jgi:uncharacterized protein YheU (UPF0270 family)
MDGAFINGDRNTTLETGEVVLVFLDTAIESFTTRQGADLDCAF